MTNISVSICHTHTHRLVISELQAMLNAVRGPSNINTGDHSNPYPGLTNFSLGNSAINTCLTVVQTYIQELLAFYDGHKPIRPESQFSTFGGNQMHSGHLVNGLPHSMYAARPMSASSTDLHSAHLVQSATVMKQEPVSSPRHTTL